MMETFFKYLRRDCISVKLLNSGWFRIIGNNQQIITCCDQNFRGNDAFTRKFDYCDILWISGIAKLQQVPWLGLVQMFDIWKSAVLVSDHFIGILWFKCNYFKCFAHYGYDNGFYCVSGGEKQASSTRAGCPVWCVRHPDNSCPSTQIVKHPNYSCGSCLKGGQISRSFGDAHVLSQLPHSCSVCWEFGAPNLGVHSSQRCRLAAIPCTGSLSLLPGCFEPLLITPAWDLN